MTDQLDAAGSAAADTAIVSTLAPETTDTELSIGEVARDFGLTLRALRFYEDRGLLTPRRVGTTRLYGPAERRVLERILRGKRLGFTLAEIADLLERSARIGHAGTDLPLTLEECRAKLAELAERRAEIDTALAQLRRQVAA